MAEQTILDTSIKILVADDYAATRDLIRAILRATGFTNIFQAENGQEAIQRIYSEQPQLVICDWNMPIANGLEVLKAVRSDSRFVDLPFIMLTAEAYRESISAAVQAGVSEYIAKPFTAEILIKKIEKVMKNKK